MGRKSGDLREQIVAGAADMIARRGVRAASIRELAKHTKAPLGSTYHYFPDGKQQLIIEALQFVGAQVEAVVRGGLQEGPVAGVARFCATVRDLMIGSDFLGGCAVLAAAVEGADGETESPTLNATAEIFSLWEELFTDSFRQHGATDERAAQLATLVIASVEGSVGMCRAKRSSEPLDNVVQPLQDVVAAALSPPPSEDPTASPPPPTPAAPPPRPR